MGLLVQGRSLALEHKRKPRVGSLKYQVQDNMTSKLGKNLEAVPWVNDHNPPKYKTSTVLDQAHIVLQKDNHNLAPK